MPRPREEERAGLVREAGLVLETEGARVCAEEQACSREWGGCSALAPAGGLGAKVTAVLY